jgi:hypothetical protein
MRVANHGNVVAAPRSMSITPPGRSARSVTVDDALIPRWLMHPA